MDQRFTITLPPGVVRNDSPYAVKGRYINSSLVRFWEGKPQKWAGWGNYFNIAFTEPARGGIVWVADDGRVLAAFGTANKLWLIKEGVAHDITPVGLTPGLVDTATTDTGYGSLGYGGGPYGGGFTAYAGQGSYPRVWTLARWGEDLVACPRGGPIYFWDYSVGTGTPAVALSTLTTDTLLPSSALGIFVTDDRELVAYGAAQSPKTYDALNIAWCNREDFTVWTPTPLNTAGAIRCEQGNQIMGACKVFGGYIVLTDLSCHTFTFQGGDDIWGLDRIGSQSGAISPMAMVEMDGVAYWMGFNNLFSYNGRVNALPCDVHELVFNNVARLQSYKICAATNRKYGAVLWFVPGTTVSPENDSYFGFNTFDNSWEIGGALAGIYSATAVASFSRTTWIDGNALVKVPLATDGANFKVYQHEAGTTADGFDIAYLLETGELEMRAKQAEYTQASDQFLRLKKVAPDYAYQSGQHALTVEARGYSNDVAVNKGPYDLTTGNMFNPKARGRTFRFLLSGTGDFRLGDFEAYAAPDGGRR